MKRKTVTGVCAALAIATLLLPLEAAAQSRGGGIQRYDLGRGRGDYRGYDRFRDRGYRDHDGFRTNFGIWVGPGWDPFWWGPLWYPWPSYYRDPYPYEYYQPPAATVPPPVYTPPEGSGAQEEAAYWYHCREPEGYYPYVQECPSGWTKVTPTPDSTPPPPAADAPPPAATPPAAGAPPPAAVQENPVPPEYRWYYCQDPPGYYPYVRDCPTGWLRVAPAPASAW